MPLSKEAYIRYKIINQLLIDAQNPYPDMERIRQEMESRLGKEFSISTIQKDIKSMKEDEELGFLAPIRYSRRYQGYYYSEDYEFEKLHISDPELDALNAALGFMDVLAETEIGKSYKSLLEKMYMKLSISRQQGKYNQPFIIPEVKNDSFAPEAFDRIAQAIRTKTPVKILHYSFQRNESNFHIIHPYLLKEYNHMWYVLAYSETHQMVRTFGLNRINNVMLRKSHKYKQLEDFDAGSYYRDCVGITRPANQDKETVLLQFTKTLSPYISATPIHTSQRRVEYKNRFVVELQVYITIELISLLMSYGKHVKVLKPEWLNEELEYQHYVAAGETGRKVKIKF